MLAVFTRLGSSIEVYRPIELISGTNSYEFRLRPGDPERNLLAPGSYTVTFIVFNALDERIGDGSFGNPAEFTS